MRYPLVVLVGAKRGRVLSWILKVPTSILDALRGIINVIWRPNLL